MRFCYKDIKEIRVLVTSHRNPAALTETVKESQLVAEQKRTADPGSHRNPLLSSLGTWGLCVLFPLLLLVQAILLPSRVSLISAVCLCDAQSHLPGKNIVLVSMTPEKALFPSKVAGEGVTLEDCFLEPSGAVSQSRVCRRHLWIRVLASPGNLLLSTLRVCSDSQFNDWGTGPALLSLRTH